MKTKYIILILLLTSLSFFAQTNVEYSSTIMDDNGVPMSNVSVRVRGTGETVLTDSSGEFTVRAKAGDVLIISKDGKRINTITLNNSNFYQIENNAERDYKSNPYSRKTKQSSISQLIDSARFYKNSNPEKSIGFIETSLSVIGKSRKNNQQLSEVYTILGDVYSNLKQYDLAVSNYETALNFAKTNSLKFKLAKAYTLNNNFDESTEMYQELLNDTTISTHQKIVIYEGLGDNSSKKLNELDAAIEHYEKGLEIAEQLDVKPKVSELNTKIGETYSQKGEPQVAEEYLIETLKSSENEDVQSRAISNNSIADYYKENKEYDKEIKLRKETLDELEREKSESKKNDSIGKPIISSQKLNFDIGNAYLNKGDLNEAAPYLEKSIIEADAEGDLEIQKDALQRLSELYRAAGKSDEALEKYQEYAQLVDVIYQQKEQEIKDAVALGKELTNKQNRINSLEKDRELSESRYDFFSTQKQLTQETYKRQRLIIYSLVGGLLLLILSLFWMYKSNKQRRLANNLLALKSLRSQMNPHFIFNALNSVNSFVSQNDERAANRYLTDFSKLMRSVLDNSEQDFIPLSKEIELLELYIKLEHSRFTDKFDYTITVDDKLEVSDFQIPPMLLQPYVENAVWHGLRYKKEKGYLQINIQQKDTETVEIIITDDGIGRAKSKELKTQYQQKQKSQGMNNIKKRIAILNEMYSDRLDVSITDLNHDTSGTEVVLTLKKQD